MLPEHENALVTRTGPGTPMGQVLRRYWVPAVLLSALPEPDSAPLRVKLLGGRLVAFRDTDGGAGLLNEACPHRVASLWLGRNEESGLYANACPTVERDGVVWAYLGPPERMPPPPMFEWAQVPATQRHISRTWEECNWLQALEGGVDSAHSSFLHRSLGGVIPKSGFSANGYRARSTAPKLEVRPTDWGFTYASIRGLGDEGDYVRSYQFVMPFHQIRAAQVSDGVGWRPLIAGHMWVPMDDENCMVYNWFYHFGDEPLPDGETLDSNLGGGPEDLMTRFRKTRNPDNDWLIDRHAQKTKTYTGIEGINTQDHAVQESMGPIVDRSQERLGSIDKAIIALRRLLLQAVKTVDDDSATLGANDGYYRVRAIEKVLPDGQQWWKELEEEMLGRRELTAPRA